MEFGANVRAQGRADASRRVRRQGEALCRHAANAAIPAAVTQGSIILCRTANRTSSATEWTPSLSMIRAR